MIKTTERHFKLFKDEVWKWIEYFGLKGWKIYFFHKLESKNSRAEIRVYVEGRSASVFLNDKWDSPVDDLDIKQSAFHEVCELMLWKLAGMAVGDIHSNKSEIIEETHGLIRILENTIFKDKK